MKHVLIADDSKLIREIGHELVASVLAAAASCSTPRAVAPVAVPAIANRVELIMIGASTGGPQALRRLITALPATLAAPIAIVLHIPAEFTGAFARRLDKICPLKVIEAADGMELRPGLAVVARGGKHLFIERVGHVLRARLGSRPVRRFTPSVDVLFSTGAAAAGANTLGVVLTGMGDDGLAGSRAIAAAGGALLTESASTCVSYGMPRCVDEAALGAISLPLDAIAGEITRRV